MISWFQSTSLFVISDKINEIQIVRVSDTIQFRKRVPVGIIDVLPEMQHLRNSRLYFESDSGDSARRFKEGQLRLFFNCSPYVKRWCSRNAEFKLIAFAFQFPSDISSFWRQVPNLSGFFLSCLWWQSFHWKWSTKEIIYAWHEGPGHLSATDLVKPTNLSGIFRNYCSC